MLEVIVEAPYDPNKPTIFINVVKVLFTTTDARKYLYAENMVEARYNMFNRVRAMMDEKFQVVLYYRGKLAARNVFKGEMKDIIERELPGVTFIAFSDHDDVKKYKQKHKASFLIGTGLRSFAAIDDEMPEEYLQETYDRRIAMYFKVDCYNPKEIFDPFPITSVPNIQNPIFIILAWDRLSVDVYFGDVLEQVATLYPNLNMYETMEEALESDGPCILTMSTVPRILPELREHGDQICILYSLGDYMERTEKAHSNLEDAAGAASNYINRVG